MRLPTSSALLQKDYSENFSHDEQRSNLPTRCYCKVLAIYTLPQGKHEGRREPRSTPSRHTPSVLRILHKYTTERRSKAKIDQYLDCTHGFLNKFTSMMPQLLNAVQPGCVFESLPADCVLTRADCQCCDRHASSRPPPTRRPM